MNNLQVTGWLRSVPHSVWAALASIVLAVQHGLNYGVANHNAYLLRALNMFDPELLANDWLVTTATDYHPVFSYLAFMMYCVDTSGWVFAIANVIVISITCFVLYRIIRLLVKSELALPIFLLTMTFVSTTETWSISGSYIFSRTFQPSSLGALGLMLGYERFFNRRYLASGVVLALGGLCHMNYLVLSLPLFGLAHLMVGEKRLLKRLTQQLGPPMLALITMMPLLLQAALSPDSTIGREIFQNEVAPQHYLPSRFLTQFYAFLGWHVLGVVVGWGLSPRIKAKRLFWSLFAAQFLMLTSASLLTTVVFIPAVSQLYVWRLAPFSVVLVLIIGAAGITYRLDQTKPIPDQRKYLVGLFIAALAILVTWRYHYGWYRQLNINLVLLIGLVSVLANCAGPFRELIRNHRRVVLTWVAVLSWLIGTCIPFADFHRTSSLLSGFPESETTLYRWVRENTPTSAVFLVPPFMTKFRLQAKRSIVIDWKSPVVGDELVEWKRRLTTITGIDDLANKRRIATAYEDMKATRLENISISFHFDYLVISSTTESSAFSDYESVYENTDYQMLRSLDSARSVSPMPGE